MSNYQCEEFLVSAMNRGLENDPRAVVPVNAVTPERRLEATTAWAGARHSRLGRALQLALYADAHPQNHTPEALRVSRELLSDWESNDSRDKVSAVIWVARHRSLWWHLRPVPPCPAMWVRRNGYDRYGAPCPVWLRVLDVVSYERHEVQVILENSPVIRTISPTAFVVSEQNPSGPARQLF